MMNHIISFILKYSISEDCINEEDLDIYSFGLECMLLKLVHYTSYIVIGIVLDSLVSLFVSACILMPLRTRTGGYHANTRIGCYFFSCSMVIMLCILNRIFLPFWIILLCLFFADIAVLLWAPIGNENRILEQEEIVQFRRQAISLLMIGNVVFLVLIWNEIEIYKYLANGIAMAAILLLLGKGKERLAGISMEKYSL
ncbi:MAG: accessory gene regulator B family protein [Lachnospiraceae bacterium]|nr:accessory gene regulator B family protein [Lachnospiraceae bacterium]